MTAWKPGDGIPDARIAADGTVYIGEAALPGPIERHSVMVVPDAKRVTRLHVTFIVGRVEVEAADDEPTPEGFADPANWHPIEEHPFLNDPPTPPTRSQCCLKGCDCSCCYGYNDDCHCVADPCNCGGARKQRRAHTGGLT